MKRFLSLFVALVMIVSLFSGVEIKVSAEGETTPTEITEVTLGDFPALTLGSSTSLDFLNIPEDAPYSLSPESANSAWQKYTARSTAEFYRAATFEDNALYSFGVDLIPKEGYTFAGNCTVNGTGYSSNISTDRIHIYINYAVDTREELDAINITCVPEIVAGTSFDCNATVQDDVEGFSVTGAVFNSLTGWVSSGSFAVNNNYQVRLTIIPESPNVKVGPNTAITINGSALPSDWTSSFVAWYTELDGPLVTLKPIEITEVDLSWTEPVKGAVPSDTLTLPTGANYTKDAFSWFETSSGNPVTGTFGSGFYNGEVTLKPNTGYTFSEDLTVTVNGADVTDEMDWKIESDGSFYGEMTYAVDMTEIDTVEISYTVPVMGSEIPEITLKNAEYFGSYYTYWYNLDTDEYEDDTFEEGEYQLEFDVYTASGCRFAEDVTFIVNGEVCECDDPNVYGNDNYTFYHDFQVVDGRSVISEIEYPAWPVCEVGDPIPEPVADSSSEDVPYFVLTEYMVIDENGSYEEASGTFEAGKLYMMTYYAVVNPDYRTDATTKFTQDGAAVTPTKLEAAYPTEVYTLTKYGNNSTLDIIDTADLQLTLPALAEEPSQVTVKETAPYQITDYRWFIADEIPTVSDVAPAADLEMVEDIFIPGYPVLYVDLTTQDDSDDFTSIFSANTKITVNGSDATVLYTNTYNPSTIFAAIVFDELKPITIPAVDFPAWPELKVGDSIPKSTTIPVDEDLHYLLAMQIQEVNGESSGESTITIEDGKTYSMTLIAYNTSDYHAFTDATVVTQNGQPTSDRIDPDIFDMPESFASRIILLTKYYNFNEDMTIVEAMDITVDEPVIGEMPGSITVDEDFPLTFIEAFWGITDDGTLDGADDKTSAWAEGDIPLIGIRISENEKAMLSPALKITVNGKSAKIIGFMPDMDSDDNTSFFITVALDALVAEPVDYDIISGNGSSWTVGSNGNVTMTANGDFSKFLGLDVDGNEVAASNYEARSGSTIVELKASYLATLSEGQHTITFNYTDGSASGTFEIKRTSTNPTTPSDPTTPSNPSNPSNPTTPSTPGDTPSTPTTPSNSGNAADTPATPETGDNSNLALWTGLLLVSALAMCYIVLNNKKRRNA